ncbi:MAG: zinc finger domain-containing protein [Candidatus Nanoarchaeia archaeon]|nr:zinc finger domain-containing protein [Candidatus Nanoarchaeia archaeon]
METNLCQSCKKELTNDKGSAVFKCPQCLKYEIKRCRHCREIGARYVCPSCGFSGPN